MPVAEQGSVVVGRTVVVVLVLLVVVVLPEATVVVVVVVVEDPTAPLGAGQGVAEAGLEFPPVPMETTWM